MFSTETALLEVSNQWLWNVDNNYIKGVIFLALKNAFDHMGNIILLEKLSLYGVSSHSVNWLQSYLSERKQASNNGVLYESCEVTCVIIWQTQSSANPCALIGSFSVRILQYMYFCFEAKPANSKFATKSAKKKFEYCHSSQ